ncbi:MAG: sensor histidine kinase [Deltaproteobacteria bacterium]
MRNKCYAAVIGISMVVISYLHYSTVPEIHALHGIYAELYYVPILLAVLVFGLKGALYTYLLITFQYLPHVLTSWTGALLTEKLLHLVFTGVFASLGGFLLDRERKNREQLERDRCLAGIGRAATTIVHDLKNPLITILGFATRIEEGKGNASVAIKPIIESARTMQEIVRTVLDFAKPIRLEVKEEDVRGCVTRACDTCRTKAEGAGVRLSADLPSSPLRMALDSGQFERALVNLISNAIEASRTGQKVIVAIQPHRDHATIRIRDTGSGMDREALENLFAPFYTRKADGTGLGMPIAKKIIEAHRSVIHVDSQPGKGTDIIIKMPL